MLFNIIDAIIVKILKVFHFFRRIIISDEFYYKGREQTEEEKKDARIYQYQLMIGCGPAYFYRHKWIDVVISYIIIILIHNYFINKSEKLRAKLADRGYALYGPDWEQAIAPRKEYPDDFDYSWWDDWANGEYQYEGYGEEQKKIIAARKWWEKPGVWWREAQERSRSWDEYEKNADERERAERRAAGIPDPLHITSLN